TDRFQQDRQQGLSGRMERPWKGRAGVHFIGPDKRGFECISGKEGARANSRLCRIAVRRHAKGTCGACPEGTGACWRVPAVRTYRRHANWHRLDRPGGVGYCRISACRRRRERRNPVFISLKLAVSPCRARLWRRSGTGTFCRDLRALDQASQAEPPATLPAWAEPWRFEFRAVCRTLRGDRRSLSGSALERSALSEQDLAVGHPRSQPGFTGLVTAFPRWFVCAVYESKERPGNSGRPLGPDADRISAICQ